ncbi:OmpA family protein [Aquipuribacter sp. MA13-6]|uniref:OmpA family protein n=1 Tax=unclassified Aquipuribacter TaxID=2635084 RepID=UPI003EE9F815
MRVTTVVCAAALVAAVAPGAAAAGVTPGEDGDLREPQTSTAGVEVSTYGTSSEPYRWESGSPSVTQAVHAVQRVGDVTVVYWSVGYEEEPESTGAWNWFGHMPSSTTAYVGVGPGMFVHLAVPAEGLLLYPVPDRESRGGSLPASSEIDAFPEEPGVMGVQYTVVPALPEGVGTVDVTLGFAEVVTDVPVGDGLLEPVSAGPVVPLGTGWPEVPERFLAEPEVVEMTRRPLSSVVEQLDGASRETTVEEEVNIDIAADVLFALDSADLSAETTATVTDVAADLAERAAPGRLTIVGHTDDQGSEEYNDDLSLRRAQAVADVLVPALDRDDLEVVVEGRGEQEPVAENDSDENRQLNRRVAVGFTESTGSGR